MRAFRPGPGPSLSDKLNKVQETTQGEAYVSNVANLSELPDVIVVIDGTHIKIVQPSQDSDSYMNRNGYCSIQSMAHMSVEDFGKYIEDIVRISDTLMDGWQLIHKEGLQNDKYITKKQATSIPTQEGDVLVTFEYHVAYSLSYAVPVLCFNTWKQDGSLLSLEKYWEYNENLKDSNMYDTLTQMDHPVLCRPFLTLHPCRTKEIMEPFFEKSKNPVISWMSVVGPFVHLVLLEQYTKYC